MPNITPFIAFADQALPAVELYVSIFKNSRIKKVSYYFDGPLPNGTPMVIEFKLAGQDYWAMNGGPHFKFTEGFSLAVDCDTQKEIDTYSEKLIANGGKQLPCGWVRDRFGLSWQIQPTVLRKMVGDKNQEKARRAWRAMLGMTKIDLAALEKAYKGK